jgi:hypothetical protein
MDFAKLRYHPADRRVVLGASKPARSKEAKVNLNSVVLLKPLGRAGVLRLVEQLRAGGKVDAPQISDLAAEDRVLFEVTVIDALTILPRGERAKLKKALLNQGYDELCSRRLPRSDISARVRIETLIELLRKK